jgi:glycerophosphoryl diester phosphodiesterase
MPHSNEAHGSNTQTEASAFADTTDWRVPTLAEVFALIARRPPRLIFLDTKLPRGDVSVAQRMAAQYMEALRRHPELMSRALIGCPDAHLLGVMKAAFAAEADFASFDGFALDHEELSDLFLGNEVSEAAPLLGAAGNRYLSIGAPYKPLAVGDFDDLLELVRSTLAETRRAESPHHGKPLCVWTIDEESEMRALAALGPELILTNRPALLRRILDELYGEAGAHPGRPAVVCHRGGPDGSGHPENTLPLIERGLDVGDAVEFDVCSAQDGAIVHHDNDPHDTIAVYRRSGGGVGEFRPIFRRPASELRRMDELTIAEIQACCGYVRDEKGIPAEVESVLDAVVDLAQRARFER